MLDNSDKSGQRPKFDLHKAFMGTEASLRAELGTGAEVAGHSGVQGQGTEDQWKRILTDMLPVRYQVSAAIVIDSEGGQSEQIDLVIRDAHFSPLFWKYGGHLYVPAESVYAVFEIKPKMDLKNMRYAGGKIASVRNLVRTSTTFGWAQGTMPPKVLEPILGGFLATNCGWSPPFGAPFRNALKVEDVVEQIDLGCVLGCGSFEVPLNSTASAVEINNSEGALVSFTLRLLQRLKGLGSAPAIDYSAYARWVDIQAKSD